MVFCYEFLDCSKADCPNFEEKRLDCWNMEDTLCDSLTKDFPKEEKLRTCQSCVFYQEVHKDEAN